MGVTGILWHSHEIQGSQFSITIRLVNVQDWKKVNIEEEKGNGSGVGRGLIVCAAFF